MVINHGPLDVTLDNRDDRQLETKEAMIDVATLRGQQSKRLETSPAVFCHVAVSSCSLYCIQKQILHTHIHAILMNAHRKKGTPLWSSGHSS
jgi:hypothetical protein